MVSYSSSQTPVNNCNQNSLDQSAFEAHKRAVYKHPLFPLLALVFERCEQATQCAEIPSSEGFNMDIQAFVQHQEKDKRPFLTNDAEVDGLMIKAIQVLRIHLLELEKVQELCKDFCTRYINCLKGKMQSENLLKPDYTRNYSENNSSSGNSSDSNSPLSYSPRPFPVIMANEQAIFKEKLISSSYSQTSPMDASNVVGVVSGISGMSGVSGVSVVCAVPVPSTCSQLMSLNCSAANSEVHSVGSIGSISSSSSIGPSGSAAKSPTIILGSTPLSQIGVHVFPVSCNDSVVNEPLSAGSGGSCDEADEQYGGGVGAGGNRRKQKRGVLPKYATSIMRSWLFQHLVHPYPTEDEKKQIAAQTNLTLLQVNNWFINARRRILQPMLDASTADKKGLVAVTTTDESDLETSENEGTEGDRQHYSDDETNE